MRGAAVPGPRGSSGEVWLGAAAVSFPRRTRGPSLVPYPLPFAFLNSCPFLFSLKLLPAFPTQGLWCGVSKTRLDSLSTSARKLPDAVTSLRENLPANASPSLGQVGACAWPVCRPCARGAEFQGCVYPRRLQACARGAEFQGCVCSRRLRDLTFSVY